MPVRIRKFWIAKHNMEAEEKNEKSERNKNGMSGEGINSFARLEQLSNS